MPVDILLGLQWGDEGKGKIVDLLTPEYDIIARFQGGPNAGHTLVIEGKKFVFHTLPSGVIHGDKINVIGSGMVIDPITLRGEIEKLDAEGLFNRQNLLISGNAHLILPTHRLLDATYEENKGGKKIGSTLKGIGPAYSDKMARIGLRMGDIKSENFSQKYEQLRQGHFGILNHFEANLEEYDDREWHEAVDFLRAFNIIDTELYLHNSLDNGESILAEGAQGSLLDINFGTYPFVTSSNTIAASACTGLGLPPTNIRKIIGVFKAYTTRVGEGPFPTELFDSTGECIRKQGHEFGSTTGRPRRCGWLDLEALRYACRINGVNSLVITKADVLTGLDEIRVCTSYGDHEEERIPYPSVNDGRKINPNYRNFKGWDTDFRSVKSADELPGELLYYIGFIESSMKIKIDLISTGPERSATLNREW